MGLIKDNSGSYLAEPDAGATRDPDTLFCLHHQDHPHQLLGAERTLGSPSAPHTVRTAAVKLHRTICFQSSHL